MDLYLAAAILITLTALVSWVNERFIGLPTPIGVMLGALVLSLSLFLFGPAVRGFAVAVLESIDFDDLLMKGMLSFLLFAGALHVDLGALRRQAAPILALAMIGVAFSTLSIALLTFYGLQLIGIELPFGWALLFGALISPTDPIAVLGLLKKANAPKQVETLITGESLFNDGVGVVIFIAVFEVVVGQRQLTPGSVALLFVEEAVGGVLLGLGLGLLAYRLLRSIDNYTVEILITLAVVMGGYTLAGRLHTSGPLAMVVAGLLLGNHGRLFAMSDRTRAHLDTFWELLDEILNAVLFMLIGTEVLVLTFDLDLVLGGLLAIPIVLAMRLLSVLLPISVLRRRFGYGRATVALLTWGGLRGGISVALALSLPPHPHRPTLLFLTYAVVAFSILVQGLTVGPLARRLAR